MWIYPKINFRIQAFCLFLCLACKIYSQVDSAYFLSGTVLAGSSVPVGSFSRHSPQFNSLGKFTWGFGINLSVEAILRKKYGLGVNYQFAVYNFNNDFLYNALKEKLRSKADPDVSGGPGGEMVITLFGVHASRIFQFKRLIVQPEISFYGGPADYDYTLTYTVRDTSSQGAIFGANYRFGMYYTESSWIATVSPELKLKYIFARKTWMDLALNLGINYFFMAPKIAVYDKDYAIYSFGRSSGGNKVMTLKDPISILNVHLGISWYFKKKFRRR